MVKEPNSVMVKEPNSVMVKEPNSVMVKEPNSCGKRNNYVMVKGTYLSC